MVSTQSRAIVQIKVLQAIGPAERTEPPSILWGCCSGGGPRRGRRVRLPYRQGLAGVTGQAQR